MKVKFVLFTGTTCKACPQMKKNLQAASIDFEERNVDEKENWALAGELRIKALPTLVVFKEGKPLASFVGVRPFSELVQIKQRYA